MQKFLKPHSSFGYKISYNIKQLLDSFMAKIFNRFVF